MEEAERALTTQGMRLRYFYVLAALDSDLSLSQQDLSRLLNLDPTTMVALIDEMESAGHVERRRNPSDRRRYILRLTEGGREALSAPGTPSTRWRRTSSPPCPRPTASGCGRCSASCSPIAGRA
ncbi:MarR family winged helix-turn-helix transcriptional regulator [Streptomyces sp. M10(2022)]